MNNRVYYAGFPTGGGVKTQKPILIIGLRRHRINILEAALEDIRGYFINSLILSDENRKKAISESVNKINELLVDGRKEE